MYHLICIEPVFTIKVDHIKKDVTAVCQTIQKVLTPFLVFQSVSIFIARESIESGDLTLIVQGTTKVDIKLSTSVWDTTQAEKAASIGAFVIVQSVLLALAGEGTLSDEDGTLEIEIARE